MRGSSSTTPPLFTSKPFLAFYVALVVYFSVIIYYAQFLPTYPVTPGLKSTKSFHVDRTMTDASTSTEGPPRVEVLPPQTIVPVVPTPSPTPPPVPPPRHMPVHIFYYGWWQTPTVDEGWRHWNHNILPHWDENTKRKFLHSVSYNPDLGDIGSTSYPSRGPYSSMDPRILSEHMKELKGMVVVVSWWGRPDEKGTHDGEGATTDLMMDALMHAAEQEGAQIAIHLEPYEGRTERTVRKDLEYIIRRYGSSPSFYRDPAYGLRPVIYMYDSYHTKKEDWAKLLKPEHDGGERGLSIRGTEYDFVVLALFLVSKDMAFVEQGGFDGSYTYFAATGFTYGSTPRNWASMSKWAKASGKILSLSVGPGYDDLRIRPWNKANEKSRENGAYYERMWDEAYKCDTAYVSVTSYNEWHEGTQVEAAVPKHISTTLLAKEKPYDYLDYRPHAPDYYMERTVHWADEMEARVLQRDATVSLGMDV
eukprot:TRINITY_DN4908_c0_g2_i1.p1 TRINITY_DN4908_c0_g2~~TRINITY_DN4908_c0_g2_i1.p1  ORF type:complete len:477 (-),score=70.74 TRINITY_DN4908_c0_g2_i1:331-1761(-)